MRIALFFDGNNFYRALRSQYTNWEINYERLADWVVQSIDESLNDWSILLYWFF